MAGTADHKAVKRTAAQMTAAIKKSVNPTRRGVQNIGPKKKTLSQARKGY